MPRNRVIHNAEAVFVGPSPATGYHFVNLSTFPTLSLDSFSSPYGGYAYTEDVGGNSNTGINLISQLTRIQDVDYSFSIPRTEVAQYGELAPIDRVVLEPPTVNVNFSYLLDGTFANEFLLGFWATTLGVFGYGQGCLQGFINGVHLEKNYFVKTIPVSRGDANASTSSNWSGEVFGFGNCSVTQYSSEGAIGGFPRATVSLEGSNMKFDRIACYEKSQPQIDTGTQYIPAVNPVDGSGITTILYSLPKGISSHTGIGTIYSALRPGDIRLNMTYDEGGMAISDAKIQSYSLNIPLSRTPLQKLGNKYPYARELNVPISANLSVTALVGDLTTGTLTEIINNNNRYNFSIIFNQPNTNTPKCQYYITGGFLDSQSYSSSIGNNKTATLNFTIPIGQTSNIIFSGSNFDL